jgi:uncharacterized membrane protein YkvA (DUF1232 family)
MSDRDFFDETKYVRDDRAVHEGFRDKARATLGKVPFLDQAVAAYFAAVDPATPKAAKAVLLGALAYFILPTDVIPDIFAGLGYTDDAAVLFAALKTLAPHIAETHRTKARDFLDRLAGERD